MGAHEDRMVDGILFSCDRARLDVGAIHEFLSRDSYWVPGIHRSLVERSIAHSICFGGYDGTRQVAFARVVTDGAGFAYLCDVFVLPDVRGKGLSKRLMEYVMAHPELQHIRRFLLATRDAHDLYAKFGFTPLAHPHRFMERYDPEALSR